MSTVPAPPGVAARPGARARRAVLVGALAALALTLGLAAALASERSVSGVRAATAGAPAPVPAPVLIGGLPLQQARCAQWVGASPAERAAVVGALARVVGGPTPYGPGTTLGPAQARRLFDAACARPFAHGFLLYELYIRAAAFRSVAARAR